MAPSTKTITTDKSVYFPKPSKPDKTMEAALSKESYDSQQQQKQDK